MQIHLRNSSCKTVIFSKKAMALPAMAFLYLYVLAYKCRFMIYFVSIRKTEVSHGTAIIYFIESE